jgi:hypothetical protein
MAVSRWRRCVDTDAERDAMSDGSAPLDGEVLSPDLAPPLDARVIADVARQIVTQLHHAVPGPAAAQLALGMAMVITNRTENDKMVSDEEFISQATTMLRMLCEPEPPEETG